MQKLMIKFSKKKQIGTSPIIATMLLLGLTVVSGGILWGVSNSYLNTQQELNLEYAIPTLFKSTETSYQLADSNIDTFDIQVTNPTFDPIIIDLSQTYLFNASDNTQLGNWFVKSDNNKLFMSGKESATITFATINTLNSAELISGDQVYVKFYISNYPPSNYAIIQTSAFTITQANYGPNFQFITSSTATQDYNIIYFNANDSEEITTDLNGVLWNYGNSNQSYVKSLTVFLENDSIFYIAPEYKTQSVVIPRSTNIGDTHDIGVCNADEACVNITIPVTKNNLTEKGIISESDTYGAFISITGLDFTTFEFQTISPPIKITMENTEKGKDHNKDIIYNTITFDGDYKKSDSKEVTFDIWNLQGNATSANIEIIGLNTTAFSFSTKLDNKKYDYNSTTVDLTPGPGKNSKKHTDRCDSPQTQACETVTWGISRNQLLDNKELTGIDSGTYPVIIRDTITGIQLNVDLIISQFVRTIHVASLEPDVQTTGKKNGQKTDLTFTVGIVDEEGDQVKSIKITATWKYPNGNSKSLDEITDKNGLVSFSDKDVDSGTHTFTITNILSNNDKKSPFIYIYDAGDDEVSSLTSSIKV